MSLSDNARALEEAYRIEIVAAAGTSGSPNKKYCRRLDAAADIIAERSGARFSSESLRKSDVPRIYVGPVSLFADEDLHAFADERLNSATLHQGPRQRPSARKKAPTLIASK
jgi:hypothetical protein